MRKRMDWVALLALPLLLCAWTPAGVAASRAPVLPDLVITSGQIGLTEGGVSLETWFFRDHAYSLTWKAKTTNKPPPAGTTGSAAAKSVTRIQVRKGDMWVSFGTLQVPRLLSGKSDVGVDTFTQVFRSVNWTFGSHAVRICADVFNAVHERNEGNNCLQLNDPPIQIVPQSFDGTVRGNLKLDPLSGTVAEGWNGKSIHLDLDTVVDNRYARYNVDKDSSLHYVASGSSPPCSISGSGDTHGLHNGDPIRTLVLDLGPQKGPSQYTLYDEVSPTFKYDVTVTCTGQPPSTAKFPYNECSRVWVRNLPVDFANPGFTKLTGTFADGCETGDLSIKWTLTPDVT